MRENGHKAGERMESLIRIRLNPRSSRDEVSGLKDGVFRIKVAAPPVEGKANQALMAFLSKALGVPKTRLHLLSGVKSRNKTIRVQGMTARQVQEALIPGL